MNRNALGPALVAFLCILALGVGASSLDSQTSPGSDVGSGGGSGGGFGKGSAFSSGQMHPAILTDFPTIPKIVFQLLMAVLLGGFLVALYLQRDDLRNVGIIVVGFFVAAIIFIWALLSLSASLPSGDLSGGGGKLSDIPVQFPGGGGGGAPSNEVQAVASDPSVLALAVVVGVLVVGVAVVFLRPTRDDDSPTEPELTESETVAELGRTAGRAADRIDDDADPTNEVYRAWHEMTDQLDVEHPQSSTPGEFARAATDAGMTREDVDELTTLFETTRYGGSDATDDRETRAVAALRRIEDRYGVES